MADDASTPSDATGNNPEVTHNPERDPAKWVTGGEPSTGAQESYLSTLAKEAGEDTPTGLTKAEASQEIERLQSETGRGGSADATTAGRTDPEQDAKSDSQAMAAQDPA